MNNKSCFLVMSYTPTPNKESILINLLQKIKNLNHKIILTTHNAPSTHTLNLTDHVIYDSNNEILNYYPSKESGGFYPRIFFNFHGGNIEFNSSFTSVFKHHGIAALSLLYNGLMTAKMLGYEKCHYIEYDTDFEKLNQFYHNDLLLNEYDSVHYFCGPSDFMMHGCTASFNLSSYTYEELSWTQNIQRIKDIISDDTDKSNVNNGMAESVQFKLLHSNKNSFRKTTNDLLNGEVQFNLSHQSVDHDDLVEAIPFLINNDVNILFYFFRQVTNQKQFLQIIVNDIFVHTRELNNQGEFHYFKICDFDDLKKISVIRNNQIIKVFDFVNDIDKENLKILSNVTKN